MGLLLLLLVLALLFAYGGVALSPLLWIIVAIIVIAVFLGPGAGWYGGTRRW